MKEYAGSVFLFSFLFLTGVLFIFPHTIQAQDLLITIRRDSLNCKMGKLSNDFYPIEFKWDDTLMNGKIHKDSVLYFRKNVFRSMDDYRLRPWYPIVAFGINIGYGHQFGPLRVGLTEDFKPKQGKFSDRDVFYSGADLVFYLSKMTGYGLKFHYRNMLSGDISQYYVGPMISLRFWDTKRKNHWLLQGSVGYGRMEHNNAMIKIGTKDPEAIKLTANALAGDIDMGYNVRVTRHFSTEFKLSVSMAYPNFVRIYDYTRINPGGADPAPDISGYCQNMNSINLIIGLKFN